MVAKKHSSKRRTLHQKYKIVKKVQEYKKKQKKLAKKFPNRFHKSKRDPGIPNSWPGKAELLEEIAAAQAAAEEIAKAKRDAVKARRAERKAQAVKKDETIDSNDRAEDDNGNADDNMIAD